MARRLILDTNVLVMSERGRRTFAEGIEADDDLAIAAITVAELCTGIELATDVHRPGRSAFLRRVLDTLPVEPYDLATAARVILTADRSARFGDLPGIECVHLA